MSKLWPGGKAGGRWALDRMAAEDPGEGADDGVFDLLAGKRPSQQSSQRRHTAVMNPARDDVAEMGQIGGDVEREAVAGDPARDAYANRRQLLAPDPCAGESGHAPGGDAERRGRI